MLWTIATRRIVITLSLAFLISCLGCGFMLYQQRVVVKTLEAQHVQIVELEKARDAANAKQVTTIKDALDALKPCGVQ